MARMYVESTPATRGEVPGPQVSDSGGDPFAGMSDEHLRLAAEARGFKLERNDEEAPAKNAAKKQWVAYAKRQGATDDDLDGLSRDEIRDAYSGDNAVTGQAPPPGQPSEQDDATKPEDEGPKKSGKPVSQTTSATRPSATQDSSSPASESKVTEGEK